MPLYFFRISNGQYSGTVCADMASSISRKLAENSEWQMELLDEAKQPVFRIRIVAESLDSA
jgi:hypothetical protein